MVKDKYKILVFTPIYKRHEIVRLWHQGVLRLKNFWPEKIEVEVFAVCSNKEDEALLKELNVNYCYTENRPLGKKHNNGLKEALKLDFDYLMQLGSDDVILPELLEYYLYWMQRGIPVFGVDKCYFTNLKTVRLFQLLKDKYNHLVGAARMIKREVLEKAKGQLWPDDFEKGLDFGSQMKMVNLGYAPFRVNIPESMVMDIKSNINIWSYERIKNNSIPADRGVIKKFVA